MSTFVLIAGAGLGGWTWQKVTARLTAAGHQVYAPSLTGEADRQHLLTTETDLHTHVDDIVNLLRFEDLHDVVLVGHSYGGVVATGVAAISPERVERLVYVDAPMGWSHLEIFPDAGNEQMFPRQHVDGVEVLVMPSPELVAFYGITDPDEVAWTLERMTPHPWNATRQRLTVPDPAALDRVPRHHIVASQTVAMHAHDALPERERTTGHFFELDGPHALMSVVPDALTTTLLHITAAPATRTEV
jgi:pimeloyl-ACP methyl ester carboxylesterase